MLAGETEKARWLFPLFGPETTFRDNAVLPCQEHDCVWPATRRLATKLARCHRAGRPRILLQRAHARDVVDGARIPSCDGARTRSCLTAANWSHHSLTAANWSRGCTAADSHHLTATIAAAPNVPVTTNPHFSCDGVDGRPTAQLSFVAQQQAASRAAAPALRTALLSVRGRIQGGV